MLKKVISNFSKVGKLFRLANYGNIVDSILRFDTMVKNNGYYAVQKGRKPGIYRSWAECKNQVEGFAGARYKKFGTLTESKAFVGVQPPQHSTKRDSCISGHISKPQTIRNGSHITGNPNIASRFHPTKDQSRSKNKNYYSVKSSVSATESRIFDNWNDCQKYVKGRKGISFKKFDNVADAINFMNGTSNPNIDYGYIGISVADFKSKYKLPEASMIFSQKSIAYCDGSSLGNGTSRSCAGYGVYFQDEEHYNISEPLKEGPQTNNRAELQAVSSCLDIIWKNLMEDEDKKNYEIKTDSEYVSKLLNDRYSSFSKEKLDSVINGDIVSDLIKKYAKVKQYYAINSQVFANGGHFKIQWVKGHAGEPGNEKADELAKAGALMR